MLEAEIVLHDAKELYGKMLYLIQNPSWDEHHDLLHRFWDDGVEWCQIGWEIYKHPTDGMMFRDDLGRELILGDVPFIQERLRKAMSAALPNVEALCAQALKIGESGTAVITSVRLSAKFVELDTEKRSCILLITPMLSLSSPSSKANRTVVALSPWSSDGQIHIGYGLMLNGERQGWTQNIRKVENWLGFGASGKGRPPLQVKQRKRSSTDSTT